MTRRQTVAVAVAAAVLALSNLVCLVLARRLLVDVAHYEEFLAFWSVFFGLFGVLSGVMNESTRASGAVALGRAPRVRLVLPALVLGAAVALAVATLFGLLRPVVPLSGWGAGAVLVTTALVYPPFCVVLGGSGGQGRWGQYAALLIADSLVRAALLVALGALGAGLVGLEWACLLSLAVALPLMLTRGGRAALLARADAGTSRELANLALACFSTACTALLVTGYPAILKGTAHGVDPAVGSALLLAVSLTRAPIMVPLTLFQGVAISAFLRHRDAPVRAAARPAGALLGLGLLGGALAWPVAPWLVRVLFRVAELPGWVYAALTLASAGLAVLTLLGALALAADRHGLYAVGWLVASGTAIVLLLLVPDPVARVVWSLAVGPLVGCAVVVAGLRWQPQRSRAASAR